MPDVLNSRLTKGGSKIQCNRLKSIKKAIMKVFKFGGASLKDARAIRNVVSIIKSQGKENLLVVLSAMGNTTDALEKIIALSQSGKPFDQELNQIEQYHLAIIKELFPDHKRSSDQLSATLNELKKQTLLNGDYDFVYDQVIGFGEIISSE